MPYFCCIEFDICLTSGDAIKGAELPQACVLPAIIKAIKIIIPPIHFETAIDPSPHELN
jgi:hypothetical protein